MFQTVLTLSALACLGLFSTAISKSLRAWIVRREIKRLKADFAKLQQAVSDIEQINSFATCWALKNK